MTYDFLGGILPKLQAFLKSFFKIGCSCVSILCLSSDSGLALQFTQNKQVKKDQYSERRDE